MKHVVSLDTLDLVVDRNTVPDLRCPVCVSLLRCPIVQCKNGHLFCSECVGKLTQCPECRVRISGDALARALFVERQIKQIRVHCIYRYPEDPDVALEEWVPAPDGCDAVLSLNEQQSHHVVCPHRFVACPYCEARLRFSKLEEHKAQCARRNIQCPHCRLDVRGPGELVAHLPKCPGFPVVCEFCNQGEIRRDELLLHQQKACPETLVPCPFAIHGCQAQLMKRGLVEEHLKGEAFKHMAMMQDRMEEQARLLKQALHVRDLRIAALEDHVAKARASKMNNTVIWEVQGWEKIVKQERRFLRSKSFSSGASGFEFFFGLFPFGEGQPPPNKMTCCLFLDLEKRPPEHARITIDFSISVVNWLYEPMTVSHFHENVQFPLESASGGKNAGWGPEDGLIRTDYLTRDSGFLSNDGLGTLTINATFRVCNIAFRLL